MRVRDWHKAWPRYARRSGSRLPETIRRTHERSRTFAFMFGDVEIEKLDVDRIAIWAEKNPDKIRYVRTVLNGAVAAGVAESNPVMLVKVRPAKRREHYIPSEEEVRQVADRMGELRKFTLLAAFSGCRVSEVCALEAHDILPNNRLRVREGKGGKARIVVLFEPEALEDASAVGRLFLREQVTRKGWLVQRTLVPWDGRAVARQWARAREAAGLPENCRFHDLRRFHASWLLDRGVSDLDCAVQLGHIDNNGVPNAELVRRIYGRPSIEAALDRLQKFAS